VIEDRGDIYGDGVNIAARLESLADPGGICLSDAVRTAVGKKLALEFEDMGEQQVKNISEPVRTHKIVMAEKNTPGINTTETTTPATDAPSPVQPAPYALELPAKPSIVVLPFTNMSGDPEQEYFSDGITEDIITELSRFREIFVIARNSSFTFKGQAVDVSEVASQLGVQYVVEGSVRKVGDRVRITVQLIDGLTANHIWADRYDRVLEDIFTVQDEVVTAIVRSLPNQIRHVELSRPRRGPSEIRAYDLVLQVSPNTLGSLDDVQNAISLLKQALDIEPQYAAAHTWLAAAYAMESDYKFEPISEKNAARIMKHARRGVELDQTDSRNYVILSDSCLFVLSDPVEARIHAKHAMDINPNATLSIAWMGYIHNCFGESEQALEMCSRAIRLDPLAGGYEKFLQGVVYFDVGQHDLAIGKFLDSDFGEKWPHLVAAYALSGQKDRAGEIAVQLRRDWGRSNPEDLDRRLREIFKDGYWFAHGNNDGSFQEGLRLAGILEK
jgi:adenylate cyclase